MLHVTPEHATACVPDGHVLHTHVAQPPESGTYPFAHKRLGQLTAGHIPHDGACHAHFPSVPRVHVASMIGSLPQFGCA